MELEIVNLIPKDVVVSINQGKKGSLLSCDKARHSWNGDTAVKVVPGGEF